MGTGGRPPCDQKAPPTPPSRQIRLPSSSSQACRRRGKNRGWVTVGAAPAAAPALLMALSSLMLLAVVPFACADSGDTIGGLPVSPAKYPVLLWLTMTA